MNEVICCFENVITVSISALGLYYFTPLTKPATLLCNASWNLKKLQPFDNNIANKL